MRRVWSRCITIAIMLGIIMVTGTCSFAENVVGGEMEDEQPLKSVADCFVEELEPVTFDGTSHQPKVVIFDGEKKLNEDIDYSLSYGENIESGKGWVLISGEGSYCGEIKKTFVIKKADVIIEGSHNSANGKPDLSWRPVKGAIEYKVYRAAKRNGSYRCLTTTSKKYYVDKDASRSKTYYYKVKAVDVNGKTGNFETSNISKVTCKLPAPKMKTGSIAKTGKTKLSWQKVKGAEKYAVYRATKKNGTYKYMTTTKKTEWIHTKALSGKKYYYWVKAIDLDNRSADSVRDKIVSRSCDLKRPVVEILLNRNAKPKLSWKKVSGAEKYEIFRAVKLNGTYKSIGKTKNAYYTDKKAKGGKTYYYRVRALDADNKNATSAKSLKDKIYVVNLDKKLVALTFDDGPGPYTKEIVNALKKHNSRATFFVLGQRVKSYKSELKAIYNGGNEIGNHSYSHPILSYENSDTIKSQMRRTDKAVKDVIGITPATMRPPGGGVDQTVKNSVGKPIIYWSIDTLDWKTRNKSETIRCVMNEVKDGSIVLMHDIHEPTMEAAVELIPKLKKKGYELVTISEMAKFKGKKLKDGTVYYSF